MPDYISIILFATVFSPLLLDDPVGFTLGGVSLLLGYFTTELSCTSCCHRGYGEP